MEEELISKEQAIDEWISKYKLHFLAAIGEYFQLLVDTIKATFWRPPKLRLIMKQMYNIGVGSLAVVAITGFFTGLVLAAQSFYQLDSKGLSGVTGLMVGKAMITELGPILTAFMVTGRVGAAMCAELGTMQVTEQIDALRTMAVNPNRYLVAPRFIAGMFMMPLLTVFSMVMGIFGGYLISVFFFDLAPAAYFDPMPLHISIFDLFSGCSKAFFFGVIIMTISCYKGMNTTGGAEGVGKTTTSSVVIIYCVILFSNFILTLCLNAFRLQISRFLS
ncbi:MAG: putative phospholipid ABC transporter permease protein MlaE [Chlamydiae bacterium]|nr:putative phospholipid ABC transporter permease protein MlaE [Chlamydiota bacterium]